MITFADRVTAATTAAYTKAEPLIPSPQQLDDELVLILDELDAMGDDPAWDYIIDSFNDVGYEARVLGMFKDKIRNKYSQ